MARRKHDQPNTLDELATHAGPEGDGGMAAPGHSDELAAAAREFLDAYGQDPRPLMSGHSASLRALAADEGLVGDDALLIARAIVGG